jgi:hypothetical protein
VAAPWLAVTSQRSKPQLSLLARQIPQPASPRVAHRMPLLMQGEGSPKRQRCRQEQQ